MGKLRFTSAHGSGLFGKKNITSNPGATQARGLRKNSSPLVEARVTVGGTKARMVGPADAATAANMAKLINAARRVRRR